MLADNSIPADQDAAVLSISRSTAFDKLGSSATFKHVFDRSICRISPHSTLPGPPSTNVCTPLAISNGIDCAHFTVHVTCRLCACRLLSAWLTIDASP